MAAHKAPAAVSPGAALPLARALDDSVPLASLLRRLKQSRDCFDTIRHLIAPDLLARTRPGPMTDTEWCVLVDNGAVAAKLRQLLPSCEAALQAQGHGALSIRIRVQARATEPPDPRQRAAT